MTKIALLVILSAGMCVGQQPCESRAWTNGKCLPFCANGIISSSCAQRDVASALKRPDDISCVGNICAPIPQPASLKCGKWTHWEEGPSACSERIFEGCSDIHKHPLRVPDLHTVTEKEWQELMSRLKRLEDGRGK